MTETDARRWAAREGAELEQVAGSEEVRTEIGGYGAVFSDAVGEGLPCRKVARAGAKRESVSAGDGQPAQDQEAWGQLDMFST
jgi:hypothetical protein